MWQVEGWLCGVEWAHEAWPCGADGAVWGSGGCGCLAHKAGSWRCVVQNECAIGAERAREIGSGCARLVGVLSSFYRLFFPKGVILKPIESSLFYSGLLVKMKWRRL